MRSGGAPWALQRNNHKSVQLGALLDIVQSGSEETQRDTRVRTDLLRIALTAYVNASRVATAAM